jgi:hypothetical protein
MHLNLPDRYQLVVLRIPLRVWFAFCYVTLTLYGPAFQQVRIATSLVTLLTRSYNPQMQALGFERAFSWLLDLRIRLGRSRIVPLRDKDIHRFARIYSSGARLKFWRCSNVKTAFHRIRPLAIA